MKKIFYSISCILLMGLTMMMTGCQKDFLEITPKGKLIASTVADYDLLLNNLSLLNYGGGFGGSAANAQVVMGDEVAAVEPYFTGSTVRIQRLFRWDDVIYEPDEDAGEMDATMRNLYTYNKIIQEAGDATDGTDQQRKSIEAEARAGRAWTYLLLINYYGKPYSENTAANDPGFPIITAADVTEVQFERASVKEVYDFMIQDLTVAIEHLPAQLTHRFRVSKPLAQALLGKIYLFMGKPDLALPLLEASLSGIASATAPVHLYDYNVTFAPGGSFLPIGLFGPNYPSAPNNAESLYARQILNDWAFTNNELVINPQTVALYAPSDLRLNLYSTNAYFGSSYPNGMLRRIGPTTVQFGMLLPDIYLMQAECEARMNNLEGAATILELFRKHRMPVTDASVPVAATANQVALVKFIMEERIREFALQGFRWFDMRRLSVDPDYRETVGTTHTLYSATGDIEETFTLRPERFTLRFPQKLMDQNPSMNNNP